MRNLSPQRSPNNNNQDTLADQAKAAYQNREFEEALRLYRAALSSTTRSSGNEERQLLLSNIVACRLNIGGLAQAEAAVENAKQCVALNDRWAKGHVRLAEAYIALGTGHSNDACNSLQRAIQLDPRHPTARQMLIRELRRDHRAASSNQGDQERRSEESNNHNVTSSETGVPTETDRASDTTTTHPEPSAPPSHFDVDDPSPQPTDDSSWSLASFFDHLQMQFTKAVRWYYAQSEDKRTVIHILLLLLCLYVAFGGRFGFEGGGGGYGTTAGGSYRKGNYETGNAYDQFYGRQSSYERHRNYHSNDDDDYGPRYSSYQQHQSQRSSSYYSGGHNNHNSSVSFLDQWNGHLTPILLVLLGATYLCHRNGIPIADVVSVLVMNILFRRRRRYHRRGWGRGGGMFVRPGVRRY